MTFEHIDRFIRRAAHPLLVLVGPTASGKTAHSLAMAESLALQRRTVEIINADSRQLYRFLDIGTGKIRHDAMRGVPHHLLDVLDPREEVSAAWYKREAERVIAQIHARGNIPFLVGGSMLYVSAIIDNLAFADVADPALRLSLHKDLKRDGTDILFQRLRDLDPQGAQGIDPKNTVYLLRALEVCITSGTTLQKAKKKHPSPYDLLIMGIDLTREELHKKIEQRTEKMFADGWVEEVRDLLRRGYSAEDPGMHSVGYREILTALASGKRNEEGGKWNCDELAKDISAKVRQYARRQLTWWRCDPRIHWMIPYTADRS